MKTIIVGIVFALAVSCVSKPAESWHPHQHKQPKAYKRK